MRCQHRQEVTPTRDAPDARRATRDAPDARRATRDNNNDTSNRNSNIDIRINSNSHSISNNTRRAEVAWLGPLRPRLRCCRRAQPEHH